MLKLRRRNYYHNDNYKIVVHKSINEIKALEWDRYVSISNSLCSHAFREKFSGSNFKANVALAYYMRKYNIYMAELHTYFISAAHTLEHLQKVVESFDLSIEIMLNEGIINSYKN